MKMHSADEKVSLRCAVLCHLSLPNSQRRFSSGRMFPPSQASAERVVKHFSDLLKLHLKTMHGLAPNWPIVPWLIDIFRRVAVPPHKCCHEDLHQHAITSVPEIFCDTL